NVVQASRILVVAAVPPYPVERVIPRSVRRIIGRILLEVVFKKLAGVGAEIKLRRRISEFEDETNGAQVVIRMVTHERGNFIPAVFDEHPLVSVPVSHALTPMANAKLQQRRRPC